MEIIKIVGIDFYKNELEQALAQSKNYVLKYRTIYRIDKIGEEYKANKIYYETGCLPITKAGRYMLVNKEHAENFME